MASRKMRHEADMHDGLLKEIAIRSLLTPQPYLPRVKATARGVFLSLPLCVTRDPLGMAIAKVESQDRWRSRATSNSPEPPSPR